MLHCSILGLDSGVVAALSSQKEGFWFKSQLGPFFVKVWKMNCSQSEPVHETPSGVVQ